jgi:pantetheine hydrolase
VYEHDLVTAEDVGCTRAVCSRAQAISLLETNLASMRAAVASAAEQGAQLVLLPEDGIHGYGFTRHTIQPFLEQVPPLADLSNPCSGYYESGQDPAYLSAHYVMVQLSCMARDHGLYLAACLGSVEEDCDRCGPEHGPQCYYNTQVVLDPTGSLVGVYHKYNLWTSELPIYDIDPVPALVTVDTPMGRLGLAICEDLLWRSPVVELVEKGGIDTLLLPLSWWDMFPHQLGHSNEDAWARGLQVNLLAANNHVPEDWNSGSGIFSPTGHAAVYHNTSITSTGRLLVADIDIKPTKTAVDWSEYADENLESVEESESVFTAVIYDDLYRFARLTGDGNTAKVCSAGLCCMAEYSADFVPGEVFSLGVFSGNHVKDGSVSGSFFIEMCTIIKCDPEDVVNTCTQDIILDYDYLTRSSTVFNSLKLAGNFSKSARVFPEALFDHVTLVPESVLITPDGVLSIRENVDPVPLVSLSLFGRMYEGDADLPDNFCPAF